MGAAGDAAVGAGWGSGGGCCRTPRRRGRRSWRQRHGGRRGARGRGGRPRGRRWWRGRRGCGRRRSASIDDEIIDEDLAEICYVFYSKINGRSCFVDIKHMRPKCGVGVPIVYGDPTEIESQPALTRS